VQLLLYVVSLVGSLFHNYAIDRSFAKPPGYVEPSFSSSPLFFSALQSHAFLLVVLAVVLLPSYLNYCGNSPLLAWNRLRPFWSAAWTVLLVGVSVWIYYDTMSIFLRTGMSGGNVVGTLAVVVMLLLARAEVVSSPNQ